MQVSTAGGAEPLRRFFKVDSEVNMGLDSSFT